MSKNKRKAISLFSGAGGMDIGVKKAGFNVLACLELDEHACSTLRANLTIEKAKTDVIEGDIKSVNPSELIKNYKLKKGELDLLFGGPPCQSFSQIGKQLHLNDERGLLLFEMVRFAKAIEPKVILVEQVKGLLSAKGDENRRGEVFETFTNDLKKLGYTIKWKVINAAYYGVAQARERVFVIAMKGTQNSFNFPEPTHGLDMDQLIPTLPFKTVGDAIKGLGKPEKKNKEGQARSDSHIDATPAGDRQRIVGVPEGGHLAAQKHLPPEQIGKLSKKDTTKYLRLSRARPSNTLRCGEIFFHPLEDRYLTPREYMRIHGYPDNYLLVGPVRGRSGAVRNLDQHRQIANSVPPPVAEVLAREIERTLSWQESSKFSDSKSRTRVRKPSNTEKPVDAPL